MLLQKPRALLALTALVFGLSIWYAASLDVSAFLTDDGGITLRYAERIAQGKGFNYNDGEAVNGSSNPLYTLVVAGLLALGLSPKVAILGIAIPALAGTTSLLFYAFARYWSLFAALVSIPTYWSAKFALDYQFDALEPTFTVFFAALLFLALHGENRVFQGAALGLLVANKLDGALAPIAFTIVWLVVERRFPLRQAVSALAAAAPTFLILLVAFGSIVPNSMLTKLQAETLAGFDPLWMINILRFNLPQLFFPALLSFLLPVAPAGRLARSVVQLWFVLVLTVYSSVDLGDPYPWYVVLPSFLLVILAVITAHSVYHAFCTVADDPAGTSRTPGVRRLVRVLGVGMLVLYGLYEPGNVIVARLRDESRPDRIPDGYAGEIARQACGVWLRKYTDGTEVLWSHFGLPSFEYKGPVFDGSLLNSRPDPPALERAPYTIIGPYLPSVKPGPALEGKGLVGVFRYGAQANAYALYARPDSQIALAGHTHFPLPFVATNIFDGQKYRVPVPGQDYRINNGVLHQAVPSKLVFLFELPEDAPITFKPLPPRRQEGKDVAIAWCVFLDGEVVAQGELRPGDQAEEQQVRVKEPSSSGRHRIAFRVEALDPEAAPQQFAWANLAGGEANAPLSSADFHAVCEPWALRIDAVEDAR